MVRIMSAWYNPHACCGGQRAGTGAPAIPGWAAGRHRGLPLRLRCAGRGVRVRRRTDICVWRQRAKGVIRSVQAGVSEFGEEPHIVSVPTMGVPAVVQAGMSESEFGEEQGMEGFIL